MLEALETKSTVAFAVRHRSKLAGYSKDEDRSLIERFLEQRRASLAFDYRERLADSFASERVHTSAWNRDGDTPVK